VGWLVLETVIRTRIKFNPNLCLAHSPFFNSTSDPILSNNKDITMLSRTRAVIPLVARSSSRAFAASKVNAGGGFWKSTKNQSHEEDAKHWTYPISYATEEEIAQQAVKSAKRLAESAEEASRHPDYENQTIAMQELMDLEDAAQEQEPKEELMSFRPHETFPVDTVEQIAKEKKERAARKAKQDDVRYHAWE
jgi:hypothetical protein